MSEAGVRATGAWFLLAWQTMFRPQGGGIVKCLSWQGRRGLLGPTMGANGVVGARDYLTVNDSTAPLALHAGIQAGFWWVGWRGRTARHRLFALIAAVGVQVPQEGVTGSHPRTGERSGPWTCRGSCVDQRPLPGFAFDT